jgi:hypothetical protein
MGFLLSAQQGMAEVMVSVTSAQSTSRINARPYVYGFRTRAGSGPGVFVPQAQSPIASGTNPRDVALGDIDGDGLVNNSDPDMHGTGVLNDIFAGADEAYAPDASAASTIAFVSAEVRRRLQIPASDKGLRVRVSANPFGSLVTGVWRYLSSDNIQVYAKWSYPANNPADIQIAAIYRYSGPYSGNPADYTNPAYYSISEESRVYSQYPGGGINFVSWVPQQPAGFYFGAIFQTYTSIPSSLATGGFYYGTASGEPSDFTPPYQTLVNALSSYPNLTSDPQYLTFSGNFGSTPGLPSLQPLINLQRTVMQVSRAWYGQQEARQIR